jgi:hypothetical protein
MPAYPGTHPALTPALAAGTGSPADRSPSTHLAPTEGTPR